MREQGRKAQTGAGTCSLKPRYVTKRGTLLYTHFAKPSLLSMLLLVYLSVRDLVDLDRARDQCREKLLDRQLSTKVYSF